MIRVIFKQSCKIAVGLKFSHFTNMILPLACEGSAEYGLFSGISVYKGIYFLCAYVH